MSDQNNTDDKINKLIALASTQSVIIAELVNAVKNINAQLPNKATLPLSKYYINSLFLQKELREMSEQLDSIARIVSEDE